MGRPHDYTSLPCHPAVSEHYKKAKKYGGQTVVADVTCPACGKVRSFPLYTLRSQMSRENFSGHCRLCMLKLAKVGYIKWHKNKYKNGSKWIANNGYVMIGISGLNEKERIMFRQMTKSCASLLEHRWVMAKYLDRPLLSSECVDHMDGNRQNNSIENLRIYVKGKNHPGSANGHGTYFHEWQMALRRIKELESK